MLAIASANQFVNDNYDVDDENTAYFAPCGSSVLVPIRKDIVGNLLVWVETAQVQIPHFIANMSAALQANGIRLRDCASVGGFRQTA